MNICMLSNEFPPSIGGVQTHVHQLSRTLVALGHQVSVLTRHRDRQLPARVQMDGIEVWRERLPDAHLLYDWVLGRKLKTLHRMQPIDIIHVHGMRPLQAAINSGLPVIFTNHTSSFLRRMGSGHKQRQRMARYLQGVDMVLAPSEELLQRTADTGYAGPLQFIPNGVDTGQFCPGMSDLRTRLDIPADAFVAVLARRLVEKNGVLDLARALAMIDQPDFHLVVAGDGTERAEFERLASLSDCGPRVHMLGAVANTDMPSVYRAADVAVLPSLMEATSITGLEAMACGLPLIGTRVGGIPAIIDDGVTGLLVEPAAPPAMAAAITALVQQRDRARAMGEKSLAKAVREFAWPQIARRTLAAYQQVVAAR
jgi:glycosyltransferase involved in cell wall biosynthesis